MTVMPVTHQSGILDIQDQKTYLNTCDMAPPSFWVDSDALEPLSGEILAPLEKNKRYTSTAGTGVRRG